MITLPHAILSESLPELLEKLTPQDVLALLYLASKADAKGRTKLSASALSGVFPGGPTACRYTVRHLAKAGFVRRELTRLVLALDKLPLPTEENANGDNK